MSDGKKEFRDWMDSQSGYIGKENKAAWWDNWNKNQKSKEMMGSYIVNPGSEFYMTGTGEQQQEQAAALTQVGAQTGQNLFQTGQQQQDYYRSLQNRRNGGDAVAAHMMNQRNRNMANMGRQLAGRGVASSVAGASMNAAQNDADSAVGSQLQNNARQNDNDLYNYVKRQQKVEGAALAGGKDAGLANDISVDTGTGITVICTELHRQGLMDDETYHMDHLFGLYLRKHMPEAMVGYTFLATPVVKLMKKSPLVTKFVAFFALPWAKYMSGKESVLGSLIMHAGLPFCSLVGKLLPRKFARV